MVDTTVSADLPRHVIIQVSRSSRFRQRCPSQHVRHRNHPDPGADPNNNSEGAYFSEMTREIIVTTMQTLCLIVGMSSVVFTFEVRVLSVRIESYGDV